MKPIYKRFFSLLLVVLLTLGLPLSAMATSVEDTSTITEATSTPTEAENAESEVTEPEETESANMEISETDLLIITPDPIMAENPYDPEWPYPYGVPVDNLYPDEQNDGIMLLADMVAIPDEMYDNYILRALEYTGYDVQWLKDNGYLYVRQYVSTNLNTYAPEVLSDIGYDDYSPYLNGDETVADSSTATGLAPDIASFESSGLVCASFVSYYWNNYLPNIEGIDTTWIADAIKATTMNNGSYSTASVWSWETGLTNLANTAGSGVTKYTDADTAYANLVPGDVIIFSNSDGNLTHAAIYAGTYNLYSTSGSNGGKVHFIIHVGNSRGPEISTVEYMVSAGTKSSSPSAWYHIELPDDPTGYIEVNKKDTSSKPLAGAYFIATDQATGDNYTIGPTNSAGYAKSGELPLSTYTVVESVFPDGYQASGQTSWTVTLTESTPNLTITINAVNELITGDLGLKKDTEDGKNLSGWQFALYVEQSCQTLITGPLATDSNGELSIEDLTPQTVWIKELGHSDPAINALYTCNSTNPQQVTIEGNKTATVSFYNKLNRGSIIFKKATTTGEGVELGWTAKLWKIESDGSWTYIGNGTTKQDKTDPTYTFSNLVVGQYVLQEDPTNSHSGYTIDTEYHYVEVTVNQTTTVTITNGTVSYAKIVKETNTGENLGGWKYNIYLDADLTELLPGSPFTTDDNGEIVTEVEPGTFFIVEVDESDLYPDWVFDDSIHVIAVAAGETGVVTFTNRQLGRAKIIKVMPDGGSVAGWEYDLRRVSGGEFFGTFISQEDGTITTGYIEPGVYEITEKIPENSIYYCEAANPQTVTVVAGQTAEVTFTNRLKPAEISIQKVDTAGNPLAGAVYLLEWSVDGVNWLAISSTDSPYVTEGTCTSGGLLDGCLTSPETGLVRFTGLHPERYYRLTEISAPDGYQLLAGAAFEGTIPIDEGLTITLTVVNAPVYELPMTGSKSFVVMAVSLCICIAGCVSALVYLRRKEQ